MTHQPQTGNNRVLNIIQHLINYIDNNEEESLRHNNVSININLSNTMPSLTAPFVKLTPILTGTLKMSESITIQNGSKDILNEVTCLCFLIEHPNGKGILFDAGLSKELSKPNYGKLSNHKKFLNQWDIKINKNFKSLTNFIETNLNFDVNKIENIILSHFHWDHCGDIVDFKNANLTMGKGVGDIRNDVCMCGNKRRGFFGFELPKNKQIIEVQWDNNVNIGPFNKCKDFYGDQSVFIVDAPGHVPGHIMLVVKTKEGWVLLTGDGVYSTKSYTGKKPIAKGKHRGTPADQDPVAGFDTITKIHSFYHLDDTKVYPAHITLHEFDNL